MIRCKNWSTEFEGNFCPECGTAAPKPADRRLTFFALNDQEKKSLPVQPKNTEPVSPVQHEPPQVAPAVPVSAVSVTQTAMHEPQPSMTPPVQPVQRTELQNTPAYVTATPFAPVTPVSSDTRMNQTDSERPKKNKALILSAAVVVAAVVILIILLPKNGGADDTLVTAAATAAETDATKVNTEEPSAVASESAAQSSQPPSETAAATAAPATAKPTTPATAKSTTPQPTSVPQPTAPKPTSAPQPTAPQPTAPKATTPKATTPPAEKKIKVVADGTTYTVKTGDYFIYTYYLSVPEPVCSIEVHTLFDSSGIELISDYTDGSAYPILGDSVVAGRPDSDAIYFNYSGVGSKMKDFSGWNSALITLSFRATATSGTYTINTSVINLSCGENIDHVIYQGSILGEITRMEGVLY